MFSSMSNFFYRSPEVKAQLPCESQLTPKELLEKFNNDLQTSKLFYHCLLKSLGLIVIGGGIVAGIYIVRAAKYADATRDKSADTGCYDHCGTASLMGTWLIAGLEGIGACVICCVGGGLMAFSPSWGNDNTLIANLPKKILSYVNEFLLSQDQPGTINTVGELRQYCQRSQNTFSV